MTRQLRLLSAFFMLVTFCSACGREITRSDAASIISRSDLFASTVTYEYNSNFSFRRTDPNSTGDFSTALTYLGYVDTDGRLTDKGKSATEDWSIGDRPELYDVPLATRELVEITGIGELQGEGGAFVEVQFTWKWIAINEIGRLMRLDGTRNGSAKFRKFDDGWRLDSIAIRDAYFPPIRCKEDQKKLRCSDY